MSIHISNGKTKRVPSENVLDLRRNQPVQHPVEPAVSPPEKRPSEKEKKPRMPRRPRRPIRIHLSAPGLKGLIQFLVVAGILVISTLGGIAVHNVQKAKGEVLGVATQAYTHLLSAKDHMFALEFADAEESFLSAETSFEDALGRMPISEGTLRLLAALPTGDTVENAYHLLLAGTSLSRAGAAASTILAPIASDGIRFTDEGFPSVTISEQLVAPEWLAVQQDVEKGLLHLGYVHPGALPQSFREDFTSLADNLPLLNDAVQEIDDAQALLRYFLGFTGRKEFVVWFQNTTELRATGGFLGSFAVLAANNGTLSVIDVPGKGPYSLNDFISDDIIPPNPLQLINNKWQVQDSNWWPDFPTSAEKFNEFYVAARGFPVDGIIAITPSVITDLLSLTGPVSLEAYGVRVDPENFLAITQENASEQYSLAANQPKKFIADLIPALFTRVLTLSTSSLPELGTMLSGAFATRDLQLYSRDRDVESRISAAGWSGEMLDAPQDALMVVTTNIGGGKTDEMMKMDVQLSTRMVQGEQIEHTLTLTRTHAGDPQDTEKGIKNMAYMRFYVPKGSALVSADGFTAIDRNLLQHPDEDAVEDEFLTTVSGTAVIDERSGVRISEELGRTVFGHWIGTEAGKSETATLVYRVPFTFNTDAPFRYSLFLQAQAGARKTHFVQTISAPENANFSWTSPAINILSLGKGSIQYSIDLITDIFFGTVIE